MTWVKICGITNLDDALVAVDAGADAVGFVFYEKSPRFVTVETAREIIAKLPDRVEKVGVFVRTTAGSLRAISTKVGLTLTQVYLNCDGSPQMDEEFMHKNPCRIIPAIPLAAWEDEQSVGFGISAHARDSILAVLLDSGNADRPGGTGQRVPSDLFLEWASTVGRMGLNCILAGGLTPENVSIGIDTLHPWGVDVASGVEARPGKKDPEKVRAFVKAVREYDARVS
jgi:phosphoribosylanthranilate isomerase